MMKFNSHIPMGDAFRNLTTIHFKKNFYKVVLLNNICIWWDNVEFIFVPLKYNFHLSIPLKLGLSLKAPVTNLVTSVIPGCPIHHKLILTKYREQITDMCKNTNNLSHQVMKTWRAGRVFAEKKNKNNVFLEFIIFSFLRSL